MNKLYVIRWTLNNGYIVSVSHFWNRQEMIEEMWRNPEWRFTFIEDTEEHCIYNAV